MPLFLELVAERAGVAEGDRVAKKEPERTHPWELQKSQKCLKKQKLKSEPKFQKLQELKKEPMLQTEPQL